MKDFFPRPLKKLGWVAIVCALTGGTLLHGASFTSGNIPSNEPGKIARFAKVPNLPSLLSMPDWRRVSSDYVDFLFDTRKAGLFLPLFHWQDEARGTFSLPAYVGYKGDSESITYFAALLTGTLVGDDMHSYHGVNWLDLENNFYSASDGIYLDHVNSISGNSFWYDVLPNVLWLELGSLYPDDPKADQRMVSIAEKWNEACVSLGAQEVPSRLPNFDHAGINLRTMQPVDAPNRIEPEGAAGIAWLEYLTWTKTHDQRFLTATGWCLQALEQRPLERNPLYEVLLPYAPLVAARMNAENSAHYDVTKLLNWCFTPESNQARPGWGVITGKWGEDEVDGLVGSTTDGGGYAFAMNSFSYIGTLAPLARYDSRFAHDLGKWLLHSANSARLFYPNSHDADHQSCFAWATQYDPHSVLAYEGLRKSKRAFSTALKDFDNPASKVVSGSFLSTHFFQENPLDAEVLEEVPFKDTMRLEHVWAIPLPSGKERVLVVAAQRIDRGHAANGFCFSYANAATGPYRKAFTFPKVQDYPLKDKPVQFEEIPAEFSGTLYLKVESLDQSPHPLGADQLSVDAISVNYPSHITPYAQGDMRVAWIDLIHNSTTPVVLYRPASSITDFGLYGSSFVGLIGGIAAPTSIKGIIQWNLLKTDYYHQAAYPTFLYYNPYSSSQNVDVDVGNKATDLYDSVDKKFVLINVKGRVKVQMKADSARVLVLAPHGGALTHDAARTLVNGIVIDYGC